MTEAEWLAGTDPTPMLAFLRGKAPVRKFRLFAVACCRRIERLVLKTGQGYRAVVLAERMADGTPVQEDLESLRQGLWCEGFGWVDGFRQEKMNNVLASAGAAACHCLQDDEAFRNGDPWDPVPSALVAASPNAAWAFAHWNRRDDRDPVNEEHYRRELAGQVPLLQCIFGNPFRPVTAAPLWLTSTVVSLARCLRSPGRDPARAPTRRTGLRSAGPAGSRAGRSAP